MPTAGTPIRLRPEVAEALAWGRPVVALESTLIAHGVPQPENLALARELEAIVDSEGGVPATVGVIRGQPTVGLTPDEVERIATGAEIPKLSVGGTGGPFRVAEGLQVVALCSKAGGDGLPTRDTIGQQLLLQKLEGAGRRYMRDLRRQATTAKRVTRGTNPPT